MPISEARKRANAAYNRKQDNIMIRPSKEHGAEIRNAAKDAGQSVQAYVLQAVDERMERDATAGKVAKPIPQVSFDRAELEALGIEITEAVEPGAE